MNTHHIDIIEKHAGQIFLALNIDRLMHNAGREQAIKIKATFMKIYRDQADSETKKRTREKALVSFLKKYGMEDK